jgi:hypothetical protein
VVDSKATLARNGFGEWGDRFLPQVLDRAAGGADQVVMMARLAPDVRGDVPRTLQPLGQPGAHQRIERAKDGRAPDVGMPLAHPFVQFLRRCLFPRLRQHGGNREPLRGEPHAGLLQGGLSRCLNHNQMILAP